jgi:hypothetical protein
MHKKLNDLEPFTDRENRGLNKRDKAFIRDIQIVNKIDKDAAIKKYADANLKSKAALKALGRNTRKRLKKYESESASGGSGKYKGTNNKNVTKFSPPSKKEVEKSKSKKSSGSVSTSKKSGKKSKGFGYVKNKEVKAYLENPKSQKDKTYARVLKRSKEHPNASKFELQHGYNSLASQKYRQKHSGKPSRG